MSRPAARVFVWSNSSLIKLTPPQPLFKFFFFHFQVTYVALGLLNHNRDLVGNSVLDCLRGKASLFFLTQFKLNIVYHLVIPS